ncbi:unnamed protein product [Miscanthus lutarioriparius]|uniref:RWP-RK domain-containing protein n=1 Tax=Miscanthus lutarioriparius TaxID=422564 RepID=A0A811PIZ6_9POAL|nr:unnamed protein product [Miscanthus lutarioriparius]
MEDRFYEEDEWYFQFQDFKYTLSPELFPAMNINELGDLYDVDFPSFWAQMEEGDAHRKSKEGDCEKALIESANVQTVAEIPGRRCVGSSETKKELTFEQVSRHFSVTIKQAARELNVGVTVLKKQCRKLGIPRWPHRKVKSLQKLVDNVQNGARVLRGLGKENAQENGHLTRSLVEFLQQTVKLLGEMPDVMLDQRTIELSQVCFKDEENAQEDGHLTRSVVEFLQVTKKLMEERPDVMLDQRTKHLRQVCFKESFKRKRLIGGHGTW